MKLTLRKGPLLDAERVAEIEEAHLDCGQAPTREAVARQFWYETGRTVPAALVARFAAAKISLDTPPEPVVE